MGRAMRLNGTITTLRLRHYIKLQSGYVNASHIIAEHFLITVRRPDQTIIDHITHNPTEYNVNDVRNLRWCNTKENANFDEATENRRNANLGTKNPMYGKTGELNPMYGKVGFRGVGESNPMYGKREQSSPNWKGYDVSVQALYVRAKKKYKRGEITESEFQKFRDMRSEYLRNSRRDANSTS